MQGQYLKFIDAELMDIGSMLQETPVLWRHYQERALRVTTIADQYGIMRDKDNMGLRTNCLDVIQRYATYDHETMRDHILSTWCERGWHQVLEDDPENVRALSGLGRYWLFKAQPSLAKVYRAESLIGGISSTDSSSNRLITDRVRATHTHHYEEIIQQYQPQYTDARTHLKAATDFFQRAVIASEAIHIVSGDLLIEAAQCHIHLAVTSVKDDALAIFIDAIRFIKRASELPSFSIPCLLRG
ncbi:hypothetical protein MMC14_007453, partial [Varicellaria rhodocarpa]|nr:hypothetical protein [Varicellaria rhodocarpa]